MSLELSFDDLEKLRRSLERLRTLQIASLKRYYDSDTKGFRHQLAQDKKELSKASTATAVTSLLVSDKWRENREWSDHSLQLATDLLNAEWASAGLKAGNAFTTAFILECVTGLHEHVREHGKRDDVEALTNDTAAAERLNAAESILMNALRDTGAAAIDEYPPTAYVTQLVVRTLMRRKCLDEDLRTKVRVWALGQITNQIALVVAESKTADLYQLAYAVMLIVDLTEPAEMTPDEAKLSDAALKQLFSRQLPDGTWPRSLPLFHYPGTGSAYCYEYEMLVQLLETFMRRRQPERLLPHLRHLKLAADVLPGTAFRLGEEALGWSSGHHPQLRGPESWSTASVLHFAHALDRLLAEQIRRTVFDDLDMPYHPPKAPLLEVGMPEAQFLDSTLYIGHEKRSLRRTLLDVLVLPIANSVTAVKQGNPLPKSTLTSAIFFGPPGTSKTMLTKLIADCVGWPQLTVDPSHIVRNGIDQVQAEANRLFAMLAAAEEIVVLLDEFDEMVRERDASSEVLSRFLTTAMLPKLVTIKERRRIIFIIATNHIEHFDLAISRPGRFDIILQIMPPNTDAKLAHWPAVKQAMDAFKIDPGVVAKYLEPLTFDEFRSIAHSLAEAKSADEFLRIAEKQSRASTLQMSHGAHADTKRTWDAVSLEQQSRVRIPTVT